MKRPKQGGEVIADRLGLPLVVKPVRGGSALGCSVVRTVEERLLQLFADGKLSGTTHTCIGQEMAAVALAAALDRRKDVLVSNHRCHGHYLAWTDDPDGLLAEVMGKATGVCGGLGGSQHLSTSGFFSNGIQGGIVPVAAGLAFAGCYMLGGVAAMLTAKLFGLTLLKGRPRPLILELPTYKAPSFTNALLTAVDQGRSFLATAGTVIVAICIVMWWLSAYPRVDAPPGVDVAPRAAQAASFAGQMGRAVAPVFEPLGFDWQLTVGVLTSFLAREVFVSTLSVLAGGAGEADVDEGVVARIRGMTREDGTPVFTASTSASALVFFVLAMQCLPTLTVTRKETGGFKYAALQLGYMSALAYSAAFLVHQGLRAIGVL